jgi:DnaJ-class molecular chaperone
MKRGCIAALALVCLGAAACAGRPRGDCLSCGGTGRIDELERTPGHLDSSTLVSPDGRVMSVERTSRPDLRSRRCGACNGSGWKPGSAPPPERTP